MSKRAKRTSSLSSSPTKSPDSKAAKGLRHFSMKVCRKVEEKGKTTYNEVADELVREVMSERSADEPRGKYDEKNIRRRVYDALNVLMAMDIISKEKKEIRWKGLPSNAHHDLDILKREGQYREKEVERKRESLRELLVQQVCFRNLVEHNRTSEHKDEEKIPLPFIVVNTQSSAVIQCEMSPDRTDVMFDFSMPFEINDDNTILKRLGM
jgi:transcription factor Dp-1